MWKKNQPSFQKNRCSIQKRVRIAKKWTKSNSWLFPKATRQKKDACAVQFSATWTECYEASSTSFRSGEKIRLEIQFHQPNKIVNGLIQSDIHLQMVANEGIRITHDPQSQDIREPEAFFPIAKNLTIVRVASTACRFRTAQATRRDGVAN